MGLKTALKKLVIYKFEKILFSLGKGIISRLYNILIKDQHKRSVNKIGQK